MKASNRKVGMMKLLIGLKPMQLYSVRRELVGDLTKDDTIFNEGILLAGYHPSFQGGVWRDTLTVESNFLRTGVPMVIYLPRDCDSYTMCSYTGRLQTQKEEEEFIEIGGDEEAVVDEMRSQVDPVIFRDSPDDTLDDFVEGDVDTAPEENPQLGEPGDDL